MQQSRTLGLALMLGLATTPALAGVSALNGSSGPFSLDRPGHPAVRLVQAQSPSQRAREQALIGQLEEEIRRLTGRIEQLEFEQRRTNGRVDQLIEDLDQRLGALEGGGGAAAAAPGDQPVAGTSGGEAADRQRAGVTPEEALRELLNEPPGDGSLGSVPESAVTGLPRPNPADVAAPERNTLTPEQQYENAVQLLQAGDYQGAQGGLEVFLDLHENHQLASNAAYWLAETHYVRQNYSASAAAFARNYRTYGKDSSKAIDNLLKLGMSLANLGENDKACLSYEELDRTFPSTPAHIQQALSRERARAQCS
jgi:tol-pal system protein YbgF